MWASVPNLDFTVRTWVQIQTLSKILPLTRSFLQSIGKTLTVHLLCVPRWWEHDDNQEGQVSTFKVKQERKTIKQAIDNNTTS